MARFYVLSGKWAGIGLAQPLSNLVITLTIINIQILNHLKFTSYKIKQNKTLGT